jgi:lipoprotein-releasing system ATP-binding protein
MSLLRGNLMRIWLKLEMKKIGFVFQFHYLLPEYNVLNNVMLPFKLGKYLKRN